MLAATCDRSAAVSVTSPFEVFRCRLARPSLRATVRCALHRDRRQILPIKLVSSSFSGMIYGVLSTPKTRKGAARLVTVHSCHWYMLDAPALPSRESLLVCLRSNFDWRSSHARTSLPNSVYCLLRLPHHPANSSPTPAEKAVRQALLLSLRT